MKNKGWRVEDIVKILPDGCSIVGNIKDHCVSRLSSLDDADENSLIWISPQKKNIAEIITKTPARVIICPECADISAAGSKCFIVSPNPKVAFLRILNELYGEKIKWGIEKSAIINPESKISRETYIGPNSYVGCSSIEDGAILYGNNYIYDNVAIGKNVIIQAGAVIGADGLGHILNENGVYENFKHIGKVIIEDGVEVGVNSHICKGTLFNTIIGKNTKIDTHVQIGHNAVIGENVIITSHAIIGGSSKVGNGTYIGLGAVIIDNVVIGSNAHIGPGAIIISNVADNAKYVSRSAFCLPQ